MSCGGGREWQRSSPGGEEIIDALWLVTGETLELLLRLYMGIRRVAIHGVHPTETILVVMTAIPALHIYFDHTPEIWHRRSVAWEGRE